LPASLFGERFYGRREPAWHGLGVVLDEDLTVSKAMEQVDIGFEITKVPLYAHIERQTDEGALNVQSIPTNSFGIVRAPTFDDPEYRVLSTVGKQWTPIQASQLARMLDPISEHYPVETMGAIGHGEKIFITLDAGTGVIAGEEHRLFYLVTDHRDGSGALTMAFTPVRVVCQNTLICGLRDARISISLVHSKQIAEDAEWYTGLFSQMISAKDTVISTMNELTTITIEEDDVTKVIEATYPDAPRPRQLTMARGIEMKDLPTEAWGDLTKKRLTLRSEWEKRQSRVSRIRDTALEQYDRFNDEFTTLARTPWALWQAIVETEDYRRGHALSSSAVFGQRAEAKSRAFTEALSLVRS